MFENSPSYNGVKTPDTASTGLRIPGTANRPQPAAPKPQVTVPRPSISTPSPRGHA